MKKIILLLITIVSLSSCSSNDDDNPSLNTIIGNWQLKSMTENGEERSNDCSRKSTVTFLENGNGSNISYDENYDGNGNATCENAVNGTFTWENLTGSIYKVIEDGDITEVQITFSQDKSTFSIEMSETFNDVVYSLILTYKKI
tara:strand:+ start:130 stop:561 length:432 start_codon:yes stop_codon:yes gene_type:complete